MRLALALLLIPIYPCFAQDKPPDIYSDAISLQRAFTNHYEDLIAYADAQRVADVEVATINDLFAHAASAHERTAAMVSIMDLARQFIRCSGELPDSQESTEFIGYAKISTRGSIKSVSTTIARSGNRAIIQTGESLRADLRKLMVILNEL